MFFINFLRQKNRRTYPNSHPATGIAFGEVVCVRCAITNKFVLHSLTHNIPSCARGRIIHATTVYRTLSPAIINIPQRTIPPGDMTHKRNHLSILKHQFLLIAFPHQFIGLNKYIIRAVIHLHKLAHIPQVTRDKHLQLLLEFG